MGSIHVGTTNEGMVQTLSMIVARVFEMVQAEARRSRRIGRRQMTGLVSSGLFPVAASRLALCWQNAGRNWRWLLASCTMIRVRLPGIAGRKGSRVKSPEWGSAKPR
jgi:hypothetical protein